MSWGLVDVPAGIKSTAVYNALDSDNPDIVAYSISTTGAWDDC